MKKAKKLLSIVLAMSILISTISTSFVFNVSADIAADTAEYAYTVVPNKDDPNFTSEVTSAPEPAEGNEKVTDWRYVVDSTDFKGKKVESYNFTPEGHYFNNTTYFTNGDRSGFANISGYFQFKSADGNPITDISVDAYNDYWDEVENYYTASSNDIVISVSSNGIDFTEVHCETALSEAGRDYLKHQVYTKSFTKSDDVKYVRITIMHATAYGVASPGLKALSYNTSKKVADWAYTVYPDKDDANFTSEVINAPDPAEGNEKVTDWRYVVDSTDFKGKKVESYNFTPEGHYFNNTTYFDGGEAGRAFFEQISGYFQFKSADGSPITSISVDAYNNYWDNVENYYTASTNDIVISVSSNGKDFTEVHCETALSEAGRDNLKHQVYTKSFTKSDDVKYVRITIKHATAYGVATAGLKSLSYNTDAKVLNSEDLIVLRQVLLGVVKETENDDYNEDNIVDIRDLVCLKKKLISIIDDGYTPTSVTLTLYDSENYGITWNTLKKPRKPVVQVSLGESFDEEDYTEFAATYIKDYTYVAETNPYYKDYYISKAVISGLEIGKTYTYRCFDKQEGTASDTFTFIAKNRNDASFKFVHVSDSQTEADSSIDPNGEGIGTGVHYANTMLGVEKTGGNPDFILHSGDMVEWSKYESYWQNMLEFNKKYFAATPVMALAGNHEATYRSGTREIFKHFNYKFTEQDTTYGIYYSFDYGNAKFIMLDTNRLTNNKLTSDQYDWLVNTLENNGQKWTIVSMHNPMYSVGKWGSNNTQNGISLALREQLSDLFAQYGVDLVLQGHDHTYSKTYPIGENGIVNTELTYETISGIPYCTNANGVIYAMHGPAGNQWRSPVSGLETEFYEYYSTSSVSSWAEIEVSEELLTVKVYSYNSGSPKLWKSYGLKK